MRKFVLVFSVTLALLSGLTLLGDETPHAEDRAVEPVIAKAVNALTEKIGSEKLSSADIHTEARKLMKENDLLEVEAFLFMELLSRRRANKGFGLGLGSTPGMIKPDGIELMVIKMTRQFPRQAKGKDHPHFIRAFHQMTAVMALTAHSRMSLNHPTRKQREQWKGLAKASSVNSLKLASVLKDLNDPKQKSSIRVNTVRAHEAAAEVMSSCRNCHRIYRCLD